MKVMKNTSLLCVLIVGALAQNAMALYYSTYGSENNWQGHKNYNQDGIDMTLYFNVYDTVANPTEFTWSGAATQNGRYIYAYQITNHSDSQDIGLFSLLDKSGNPLAQQLMHSTSTQWDGSALSVAPDPKVSGEQGIWQWSADGGFLTAGKNSWYLIFSSDNAPVKGSFKVETSSETEPPTPDVPEPCTLALFGAASALLASKRSRKCRAG